MPDPIIITPVGGIASATSGAQSVGSTHISRDGIFQVIGLVPLDECDLEDCREEDLAECYINPVFGNVINGTPEEDPSYENDVNGFLVSYPANTSGNPPSITWSLEKCNNLWLDYQDEQDWEWQTVAVLSDNTYGTFWPIQSISGHDYYTGYDINWAKVVHLLGRGFYRVKATINKISISVVIVGGIPVIIPSIDQTTCMVSKIFFAEQFDCEKADGTVKFETSLTGSIGSIDEYYTVYNLCGFQWYDSLRIRGFFGEEKSPKYDELNLEYQSGQIDQVHNKLTNRFTFHSYYLPKFVHDRLKAYMMMADVILVSDYNYNNSDYTIKRKGVRPAGGYEPTYLDKKFFTPSARAKQRTSDVKVEFREAVESVIKSLCCPCP